MIPPNTPPDDPEDTMIVDLIRVADPDDEHFGTLPDGTMIVSDDDGE